jgi:rod shape-determining protein MreC
MFATRASRRRGMLYAILMAAGLLLLALSGTAPMRDLQIVVGNMLTPAQSALSGATRSVGSIFGALSEIDQLQAQNRALEQQNQQLQVENRQLQEIRIQNDQLSALLGVQGSLDYSTVAATVVSREVSQYTRVITIDAGTDRGIALNDVVVADGGALVGSVWEVGSDFSRILLISDTRSTVIGLIESSRATGEVIGQLGGALVMQDIPATERVNLNDTVVTAGIDLGNGIKSPFPKGLLIGNIVDVQRDPNAVVQTAFINPASNLDKLEYVLVITDYHGGLPPAPSSSGSPAASGAPGASVAALPLPQPSLAPAP